MARLQSSLLLRRNHGNAGKADPDAAAPYAEVHKLLLSADKRIKLTKTHTETQEILQLDTFFFFSFSIYPSVNSWRK